MLDRPAADAVPDATLRLAAVACRHGADVATVFAAAAAALRARGLRVGGLVQHHTAPAPDVRCTTLVEDLADGRVVDISQRLGAGSAACNLDSAALADVAAALGRAVAGGAQVLLVVKFGKAEAEGGGLIDEIAAAVAAGRTVVVAVTEALLPAFRAFVGGEPVLLPADADAIAAWCTR